MSCKFCGGVLDRGYHVTERWRLEQHNCELYELRALRDQLLAYGIAGHLLDSYGEEFEAIIARAQELAK